LCRSRLAARRSESAIQYKPQHRLTHKNAGSFVRKQINGQRVNGLLQLIRRKGQSFRVAGGTVWSGSNAFQTRSFILEFSSVMIWLFEMTCGRLTKSTPIDWDDHANK
jgi:hypothetical protein